MIGPDFVSKLFIRKKITASKAVIFFLFLSLFFTAYSIAQNTGLPDELFAEQDWNACITECSRTLTSNPADEQALLLKALCELRLGKNSTDALRRISDDKSISRNTRNKASYELGKALWSRGHTDEAYRRLKNAYEQTQANDIFIRAGCSLYQLLEQHPDITEGSTGLMIQLETSSKTWPREIWNECAVKTEKKSSALTGKPGEWLIWFYRKQISPALGNRCSLYSSCSEYGMQALRKHGALGIAFIADRGVREPSVLAEKKYPLRTGNHWLYKDPVEDHDWWMRSEGQKADDR